MIPRWIQQNFISKISQKIKQKKQTNKQTNKTKQKTFEAHTTYVRKCLAEHQFKISSKIYHYTTLYRWSGETLLSALSHWWANEWAKPRTTKPSKSEYKERKSLILAGRMKKYKNRKENRTRNTEILLPGHASGTSFDNRTGRGTLFVVFCRTSFMDVFYGVTYPYISS